MKQQLCKLWYIHIIKLLVTQENVYDKLQNSTFYISYDVKLYVFVCLCVCVCMCVYVWIYVHSRIYIENYMMRKLTLKDTLFFNEKNIINGIKFSLFSNNAVH